MDKQPKPFPVDPNTREDEIDMIRLLFAFWKYRYWIIGCTFVVTLIGVLYALLATPIYYSQATISLKETGKGGGAAQIFSQLGGMGGMVAAQLGMGNTNLDKMEIILKGHELAESVIVKNGLMPVLFPKARDVKKGAWKDSTKAPTVRDGIKKLQEGVLAVRLDVKKNVIKIGAYLPDSLLAKQMVDFYLAELNERIRTDVMREAENNRDYLEKQVRNTGDPVLVEKIQNMISFEIEKYMLVSSQAFEVLERPVVPMEKIKPRRKMIAVVSLFLGIFISIGSVLLWRGFMQIKTQASK